MDLLASITPYTKYRRNLRDDGATHWSTSAGTAQLVVRVDICRRQLIVRVKLTIRLDFITDEPTRFGPASGCCKMDGQVWNQLQINYSIFNRFSKMKPFWNCRASPFQK